MANRSWSAAPDHAAWWRPRPYEARAYGVHSALGSVRARRLCPHAVFLPGDHAHYGGVSALLMEILRSVTPLVEPLSLDEAFLDVTGVLHGTTDGRRIAEGLRSRVRAELELDCAVGVAPSKFVAKLASKEAKPRAGLPGQGPTPGPGVTVVTAADQLDFLHRLPVRAMWGVGPATAERLTGLGVHTVGALAAVPLPTLTRRVGKAAGAHLHALANGIDDRAVVPDQRPKSIGHEETFPHDHHALETLRPELLRLVDATARRLHERGLAGRTIAIKLRSKTFQTTTRSETVADATASPREIGRVARALLDAQDVSGGVRLLGVSVSALEPASSSRQLRLDALGDEAWVEAEAAVDAIRDRFGAGAIAPAGLLGERGVEVRRRGDQQWGPKSIIDVDDQGSPRET